jgi:hypothetical protein
MEQYIKLMNEDDDKDTVSQVCTCTADILKTVSYDSIQQCKFFFPQYVKEVSVIVDVCSPVFTPKV